MTPETGAALIQAAGTFVPTFALAIAAFIGLDGWRKQLQGARAVERAEACLESVHELVDLVRAARSSVITTTENEVATAELMREASNRIREEALGRAWASWKTFAAAYRRAGFFMAMPKIDAVQEVTAVLTELSSLARLIATYEPLENDQTSLGPHFRQQLVGYRSKFLGFEPDGRARDPDNELDVHLRNAVAAVEEALLPVTGGRK